MTTTTTEAIEIHGVPCEIRDGDILWIEPWHKAGRYAYAKLTPCDDWDEAEFRLELPNTGANLACNVKLTGRKCRWDVSAFDGAAVRVAVTFVNDDDEPNETVGGFIAWNTIAGAGR